MAKLAAYKKNLKNDDLLERTKYMIRADQFADFINDPANRIEDNRHDLIIRYTGQISATLQRV